MPLATRASPRHQSENPDARGYNVVVPLVAANDNDGAREATSYGYDGASRLSTLTHNLAGTAQDVTQTFAYSPAGGIVSEARSNSLYDLSLPANFTDTYAANGLNQQGRVH
jgi:YD repeat-containing protein